ncbi:MAG: hypothetical protein CUN55_02690 [Phototrophicales bacterium]|nr:MAG: hypothetical protein CUN55_02690 [Phototrophicales bacterium]
MIRRWEYLHVECGTNGEYLNAGERIEQWEGMSLQEVLNALGNDGWELTTMAYEQAIALPFHLIFKREVSK